MKILITGGKSAQALKLLKIYADDKVVLADYGEMPSLATPQYYFISLGKRNDDIIAHNLLNHCLDESAEAIFPLHDFEIGEVDKSRVLFEEFGIKVVIPDADQVIR
ncbi:MAG: hypothetical protein EOP04_13840 [Proteobacteria bacterium]|nr:MAG: hypothetical protein EOP04_13840 [Pseudomonadota bacterium]